MLISIFEINYSRISAHLDSKIRNKFPPPITLLCHKKCKGSIKINVMIKPIDNFFDGVATEQKTKFFKS